MTTAAQKVLVIGGGFSGMSLAIELRKRDVQVDLVEIDPAWRNYGAGISIAGAALRAFEALGVLDRFLEQGAASDGVDIFAPNGTHLQQLPTPRLAGPDVPGNGGIMRPVLAAILADATRASGADVRLGCTFTSIEQDDSGVDVTFTDGSSRRYDLVVAADGVFSKVREVLLPDAPKPRYMGQGVWRAVLPRPSDVVRCSFWVGPKTKVGVNPVSRDQMYLFVLEDIAVNERIPEDQFVARLKGLLEPFTAPLVRRIYDSLGDSSLIVYRPLEGLLVPLPWHRGRVALIGDTVHATTPHLAAGACIGIEDAIVLAEELEQNLDLSQVLQRFGQRRWERCRMVVENSGRLGEIEISGGDKQEHARIMRESLIALAQPI